MRDGDAIGYSPALPLHSPVFSINTLDPFLSSVSSAVGDGIYSVLPYFGSLVKYTVGEWFL